ncbi:hypothetical protein [Mycolicibacterium canariasense]|nr:hypothetical protein [Mycolicibacterium canariasense]ORV13548.1 hypothetical protein AWB94_04825 [Mycolicibacterium canariasense]
MPREYAKNLFSQWSDEDFCNQPVFDKLLFQVLNGQRAVNLAGIQPINLTRWRKAMRDGDRVPSEREVKAALIRMERRQYVYTDEDTGEVLIRTRIRNDDLAKQPNQFLSALRLLAVVDSRKFAAVMAAELDLMVTPDVRGETPQARVLRENLKVESVNARTHLRELAEGFTEPFPEPFQEDFTGGLPEGFMEPFTRPGKTEPSPEGFPEAFRDGSVYGSVSGSLQTVGGHLGGTRASAPDTAGTQPHGPRNEPPNKSSDQEPPHRCAKHRQLPADAEIPDCGPCANFRQAHERWTVRDRRRRAEAAAESARAAAALKAQAIANCELCDRDGYRIGTTVVCDHQDRAAAIARGQELVRKALTKPDTKETDHA